MFVATAWILRSAQEFEADAALCVHAERQAQSGGFPLHILVLSGYPKLDSYYVDYLKDAHIFIHNVEKIFQKYESIIHAIRNFANDYEAFCFVRWLVVRDFWGGVGPQFIWT